VVFPAGAVAATLPLAAGLAGAAAAADAAGVDRSDLAGAAPFVPRSESPPIRAVGGLSLSLAGIFGSAVKPGPLAAGGMAAGGPPNAQADALGCREVVNRAAHWVCEPPSDLVGQFMNFVITPTQRVETVLTKTK
jgi:hypothetical protein